jgi:hypothetical protein
MVHTDPEANVNAKATTQPEAAPTQSSRRSPRRDSHALAARLSSLAQELRPQATAGDRRKAERRLRELAVLIESETVEISLLDSVRALRRLTQLFGSGCVARKGEAFTSTAAGYAAVVVALSRRTPALDLSEAIGQLLELMIRLFQEERASWAAVYRHLRSIPDTVDAKQQLKRVCAADIREWFDAGVQNLFGLRADLEKKIKRLEEAADTLAREIQSEEAAINAATTKASGNGNLVVLADWLQGRQLAELRHKRQAIIDETADKADTVALINADIREFEQRLGEARRAYLLRLV